MKIRYVLDKEPGDIAVYATSQPPYYLVIPIKFWALARRGEPEQDDIVGMVALQGVYAADEVGDKNVHFYSYYNPTHHTKEKVDQFYSNAAYLGQQLSQNGEDTVDE